jgi:hypothetical protein
MAQTVVITGSPLATARIRDRRFRQRRDDGAPESERQTDLITDPAPAGLVAGAVLAAIIPIGCWRHRRPRHDAGNAEGTVLSVLPPADHDRPAESMLADLARSSTLAASGPRLFGSPQPAAFGREVRISARRISYRDYAAGPWSRVHAARLEHLYPGIRVDTPEEGPC